MALTAGARLGPYEIIALLGAGGMGEVYRARDPRIGREVAVKVLRAAVANNADRLRRFQQEVEAAGALNHPNILAIYDVGTDGGTPYIVSELLAGETLRQRLSGGALGQRKTIEYAIQVARGLEAAHEKGIVHRDLKPENIFLTEDDRVKILDFGLAKLTRPESDVQAGSMAPTVSMGTEPGVVMGTVTYMSPEQAQGRPADHRADIFSFGCVLYEMLSGRKAFLRATTPETMTAILKEEPPPLADLNLDRIVRHCLEKNPNQRFHSAGDLAFALEAVSGTSMSGGISPVPAPRPWRRLWIGAAGAALVLASLAVGRLSRPSVSPPTFQQLTFRRGTIYSARFAPDGQTIVYGAEWDGKLVQLFSTRLGSPESTPLPLPGADVLSISPSGEMAICLARQYTIMGWIKAGTLARVPLAGGAPREVLQNVQEAAWTPDGSALAIVRDLGGQHRLEYPIGKSLYETDGWISHPSFSPKGDEIAFLDHPVKGDDIGHVAVVDLNRKKRDLTGHYGGGTQGLAWTPSGEEIWYAASETGINMELRAVKSHGGASRVVARIPGRIILQDIFPDGRVLFTRDTMRPAAMVSTGPDQPERDLAWLDLSMEADLSPDGKTLLLGEQGVAGGRYYGSYLRKTDGSPAVRIGDGVPQSLSPDGKWALALVPKDPPEMTILPTGPGEPRVLPREKISQYQETTSAWLGDGKHVLFSAAEPGHRMRLYVQDVNGGAPHAISGEGVTLAFGRAVSPDGHWVVAVDATRRPMLYPVEGGQPRLIPGLEPDDWPAGWAADGRSLYVSLHPHALPAKVCLVDIATGQKKLWKQIMPPDPAGSTYVGSLLVSRDGRSYVYGMNRVMSDLYLVQGLR